jgi:vacuolar-type H+-ATPase subunit I/STV1
MVNKYDRQRKRLDDSILDGLKRNEDKSVLIQKLKQKKIVIHYMNQCRQRINQVMQKQYAVEQLKLTAMQIEALQETVGVFQSFNKKHNIDKIEELQSTMADLTDQVMDINETIGSEPLLDDFDEDELLKELNSFDVETKQVVDFVEVPLELPEIKIQSDKVALLQ